MSASRVKKERQQRIAEGYVDPRKAREAEELAKQRKSNRMYAAIAIIFVVVAAALLVWNSHVIQRNAPAVTVNGKSYSAAVMNYYYHSAVSDITNSAYYGYTSLNVYAPFNQQEMTLIAKQVLGIDTEKTLTWDEYFTDTAKSSLVTVEAAKVAAEKDGFTISEKTQELYEASLKDLKAAATEAGYSVDGYVKYVYGSTMSYSLYEELLMDTLLANAYHQQYNDSLVYTEQDLLDRYNKDRSTFDTVDYEYVFFKGVGDTVTDADGNTVQPTDEENAAAMKLAKESAESALQQYKNGDTDLSAMGNEMAQASYTHLEKATYAETVIDKWAFDSARKEGDYELLTVEGGLYLIRFNSRARLDENTVNVRHILFEVDDSALDTTADDYEESLEALFELAQQEAGIVYEAWQLDGATEEAFIALVDEFSDDAKNAEGGLYERVHRGQMVEGFDEWIFDESRKEGDCGIVKSDYGYHIIYFKGEDVPYWKALAEDTLRAEEYAEWRNSLIADYSVTDSFGMVFVG
ncbi:MAG: hypothetical protein E7457_02355 [Ruminococcaceae bacterium]|nr:hypothetical protein [Oscillospiraceae bacterium]